MTLVLWKSPVVYEAEDAERLLKSFYETEDESAFDPSADVAAVSAELLRRFPDTEDGPWADGPPYPTERVLLLSIRWGADDAVLDAITELARRHELILYDPRARTSCSRRIRSTRDRLRRRRGAISSRSS
jgi:hypothetical protein